MLNAKFKMLLFVTHFNSLLHFLMLSDGIVMQHWAKMGKKALLRILLIKILNFDDRSRITDKQMFHISML